MYVHEEFTQKILSDTLQKQKMLEKHVTNKLQNVPTNTTVRLKNK